MKETTAVRTNNSKILIVDDEKDLVDIISWRLDKLGYESIPAYNGRDAIKKIEMEKPDLIFLDIAMPRPDGFDVLRWLRNYRDGVSTPVIMLTANNETGSMMRAKELSSTDYMVKPVKLTEVEDLVKRYLPL